MGEASGQSPIIMTPEIRQAIEYIFSGTHPADQQDALVESLISGLSGTADEKAKAQTEIRATADCYRNPIAGKTPAQCLDEIVAGTGAGGGGGGGTGPATLAEAKQRFNEFAVEFVAEIKTDVDLVADARSPEVKAKIAELLARLNPAEQTEFKQYAEEILEAALTNRKQIDSDQNAALILLALSAAGLVAVPVPPTFEGNLLPFTSAHTVTIPRLTPKQYQTRRLTLGTARLFNVIPPYDRWIYPIVEGDQTSDTRAQFSLTSRLLNDIPRQVTLSELLDAEVYQRGQEMPGWLEAYSGATDGALMFALSAQGIQGGRRQKITEEICSHPDVLDSNQLSDSPEIKAWERDHPGEPVPVEVLREAQKNSSQPIECDEIVNFAGSGDNVLRNFYLRANFGKTAHGLTSDVIANHGLVPGLAAGALASIAMPRLAYAMEMDDPENRWTLNRSRIEEETSRTPPGVTVETQREGANDEAWTLTLHGLTGTALAAASFRWGTPGNPYDPFVAAAFTSAYSDIVRAWSRENFYATQLRDSDGSKLSLMPVAVDATFSSLDSLGEGYADMALLARRPQSSTGWEWGQRGLVAAGRLATFAVSAGQILSLSDSYPEQTGTLWKLLGGRVLAYGVGAGLHELDLLGEEARQVLEHVDLSVGQGQATVVTTWRF